MRRAQSLVILIVMVTAAAGVTTTAIASRAPHRWASAIPFFKGSSTTTCRDLDHSYIQFDIALDEAGGYQPGRVLSVNDGTLATLVVVTAVDDNGSATEVDFATSVRVGAIIIHSDESSDVRAFDPAVRSGSRLGAPGDAEIDAIAFCYRVNIPSPPKPSTPTGGNGTASVQATDRPEPTPTTMTLDLSGAQTADAGAASIAMTATSDAGRAAEQIATSEAIASEIAATATAAAESANETQADLAATIAVQQNELATLQANAEAAKQTADALQTTVSAPTVTPQPTATPYPTATQTPVVMQTTVVYETSGDQPFTDWQPTDGWDLSGSVAKNHGSGDQSWLVAPATGSSIDTITEIDFKVTGGDICPRNFGVAVRGSDNGFYAAGIEWACDPSVMLWAGAESIANAPLDQSIDLDDGTHELKISAIGDHITVAIDGIEVIAVQDERFQSGNVVAFWSDGVGLEIDHVRIAEVEQ